VIGTTLGSYEISALAGRGGMGEVYRARDARLKRTVAIKILPAEFAADPERVQRFQLEAEALASLNHPNIAAIHTLDEANGTRFLVLEFVEGETLAERVRRGPLPPAEVVAIAVQICHALAAAHDHGIVHRDLKPANIKIGANGQVKLLDFGLARMFAPDASRPDLSQSPTVAAVTQAHAIAGTAAYMAPEQARGRLVDKRADMWALGCVLYEMVTGRPVFAGETVTDVLAAVVTQEPALGALPATTPPQLRWLIGRCLQKDVTARFRDAADAAAVLAAPIAPAVVRERAPRRWIAAAVAAMSVAVAALTVLWYLQPRAAPLPLTRFDMPAPDAPINQSFAVSPDGRRVAFVAPLESMRLALWVRSLDALDATMIQGTEATRTFMAPAWSPDSRSLAFVADNKLKKVDVSAGVPETLASVDTQIGGIAWNAAGVILFASNEHGLRRVSAAGGEIAPVTQRDAALDEIYHDCPVFLPDGEHFLYLAYSEKKPENRAVYVGSLGSASRTRLMTSDTCVAYAQPGYILQPRGRGLVARPFDAETLQFTGEAAPILDDIAIYAGGEFGAFAVSDAGTLVYRKSAESESARSLVWMNRSGGTIGSPAGAIVPATGPVLRLSPDAKRVAFSTGTAGGRDDIWVHELERNTRLRLTTDPDVDHGPIWSADGSRIAFDSHRRDRGSVIYEIPANGAVAERVLLEVPDTDFIAASDWSRDGRFLVFHKSAAGTPPWSLWVLPLDGTGKPFLYRSGTADNTSARLSPDGRWLAYATNESGTYQIVVQPFPDPSGGKWQVSADGGTFPAWRGDGRELYYIASTGDLMAVAVNTAASFAVGASTRLFRSPLRPATQGSVYDVTADGQRFLFAVPVGNSTPPLTTILNWTSLVSAPAQ
jgi:Tol biopolymer transport system component